MDVRPPWTYGLRTVRWFSLKPESIRPAASQRQHELERGIRKIMKSFKSPSTWDAAYAANMAVACLITYFCMTYVLSGSVSSNSKYLGGMWAAIATIYVFRDTHEKSLSAGVARFIATCVSFLLCLLYLCIFPPSPVGMVVLIGIGTLVMISLGRRDDIFTTGITTAVVMVVAVMDDHATWTIPLLRLLDTVVGIAIGLCAKWIGACLYYGCLKKSI